MKNVKINLDRRTVDSKSIQAHKDFNDLMKNHTMTNKPFYKSPWFIGTTGLASITIAAGIVTYNNTGLDPQDVLLDSEVPPELTLSDDRIIIASKCNMSLKETTNDLVKKTFEYSEGVQNEKDDNKNTLDQSNSIQLENELEENTSNLIKDLLTNEATPEEIGEGEDFTALMPRIGGKVNGAISKEELFDNKGIITQSDVSVVHFELHLIDGLGGKVFEEEGNHLNDKMKAALKMIGMGETIYFENIKGITGDGDVVRLNPLRYVLMN